MKSLFILFIAILLNSCTPEKNQTISNDLQKPDSVSIQTNQTPSNPIESNISQKIDLKVFFSKNSGSFSGGVDDLIIEDINKAKESIYLAMYDFTNDKIKDALLDAKNRGVDIQILTDDTKILEEDYQDLNSSGVLIFSDKNSSGLMHNKFLIVDKKILWSGSANYTYYSFYRNSENLVKIVDENISRAYLEEFNELKNHQFIPKSYRVGNIEIYFSPEDNFESRLITLIDSAKSSINFLIFTFTDKDIADALLNAKRKGVKIKGVFDKKQNDYQTYSKYDYLLQNGVDVRLYGGSFKLHDKVMIIDNQIVVTGSYNFTERANTLNRENSLVINSKDIADIYKKEFDRVFEEATN